MDAPAATHYVHRDYYAILEIPPTADEALIKSSYRRLAKLKHPDKNPDKPDATSEFQLLSDAYSTLANSSNRRKYDAKYYPSVSHRHATAGHSTRNPYGFPRHSSETSAPCAGPVPNDTIPDPITHCNATIDLYTRRVFELDGILNGLYANYSILSMQQITAEQDIEKTENDLANVKIAIKRDMEAILNKYKVDSTQEEASSPRSAPSPPDDNETTTTATVTDTTYRNTPLSEADFKTLNDCIEKYQKDKHALETQLVKHNTTAHNLQKRITRLDRDMSVVRDQRTWAQQSLNTAMSEKKFWKADMQAQNQARQQQYQQQQQRQQAAEAEAQAKAEAEARAAAMNNTQVGSASASEPGKGAEGKKKKENKDKKVRWQVEEEKAEKKVLDAWRQEARAREKRREEMKRERWARKNPEQESLHRAFKQKLDLEQRVLEEMEAEEAAAAAAQRARKEQGKTTMTEEKEVEAHDAEAPQDSNN
ncbi:DnaJ domain-containing protein [Dichotomopilus funicola]|uniref:DnaJ domain-containing protein n=1 Tax=Dichotomopilus funicola TaxID=1934379 RepID=A0AAN6ZN15_9PEZI|nr:DnaJ domain-containing protein [Dichotomopilus funicola]